jgi:hypothetical protein
MVPGQIYSLVYTVYVRHGGVMKISVYAMRLSIGNNVENAHIHRHDWFLGN